MRLPPGLLSSKRWLPDIRQAEAAECGLACLAMIAQFHGRRVDLNTLRHEYPVSLKGMTLKTLMDTSGRLGFSTRPLRLELKPSKKLANARDPALGHVPLCGFEASRPFRYHDP